MTSGRLRALPSQTIGPFYHLGLTTGAAIGRLAGPGANGTHIRLRVRLFDGAGGPVDDGMIELWQADAEGRYVHSHDVERPAGEQTCRDPGQNDALETARDDARTDAGRARPDSGFSGFGRLAADADGAAVFETIVPGRVPFENGLQAPHIDVSIFARGLLVRLCTRIYFEGDPALAEDPILVLVPPERRTTLIARRDLSQPDQWNFDIHLQGEHETAFFDL